MSNDKRVALVIGSGSVKCAAALGLLKVLEREGVGVSMIVGCSAGAIFGALMAMDFGLEKSEEMTYRLWTREITGQRNSAAILKLLFPGPTKMDGDFGLVSDRLIMERLREAFGDRTIADAKIPFYVVATDFMTGEQVVMTEEPLVDALRASFAIPFVFEPYAVNGRLMMDGFMSNALPVDVAMRENADVIIALGFQAEPQTRVNSVVRFAFQITTVMSNNLMQSNLAFQSLAHHDEVITILPDFEERIKAFDVSKLPQIIAAGEKAMQREVDYVKRLLDIS